MAVRPPAGPYASLAAVTPHDTNANNFCALWVGGAGDVALQGASDSTPVTILAVPAGTLLPMAVKLVLATGTTATSIVGLK
jgi:hypothetical protein